MTRAATAARAVKNKGAHLMMRLIKFLFFLGLLGFLGLVGFAYLGDLQPPQTDVTQPVTLDAE